MKLLKGLLVLMGLTISTSGLAATAGDIIVPGSSCQLLSAADNQTVVPHKIQSTTLINASGAPALVNCDLPLLPGVAYKNFSVVGSMYSLTDGDPCVLYMADASNYYQWNMTMSTIVSGQLNRRQGSINFSAQMSMPASIRCWLNISGVLHYVKATR